MLGRCLQVFILCWTGLLAYLLSDTCDIFNSRLHAVTQDMDQPLSHYFINSSHKTYLLEDQLKGPSSVAAYTRVLKQGCRYIEIDCWDGPTEPIVYHGRTLTSKILFADVISTVNEYAFLSSPYPLIVSLENHCCLEQQRVIVDILKTKLGDKLYTTPINGNTFALPSPNQLKYKILIKCKKIEDSSDIISAHGYVSEEDNSVEADWKKITRKSSFKCRAKPAKEPSKQMPMLRELSDLVIWCQSSSLEQFAQHGQSQKPWHVTSMSDTLVHRLMESSSALMEERVACNRHCLARVYPSCSKVDSSNYNPQPMWNCGFQIVALNQQTQGLDTDLNIARFKSNGSCGYVLKPAILRQPSAVFNPEATGPLNLPGVVPRVIQLKVISGHRFPKPLGSTTKSSIIDPYVLIEMFGIRADCANFRTKTVPGNGQNPFFDESFTFYTHFPEMALLKFTVLDDEFIGDEFIAQYTIPVDCINTGYRHINLLSSAGNKLAGCTLFVHITATHGADKKPMRRGNSTLNRLRVVKEAIAIKLVGIKAIDDTTKCLINNLSELAELKFNVETALIKFKEACDVGSVANIKYCVRTIANRACNAKGLTIKLVKSSGLPTFIISDGTPPDILKKALQAYLAWCKECKTLIDNGEPIRKTLLEIQALLRTIQSEMNSYVEEANLSEKKSQKALENFSWNMRVLKEQLTSLDQYTETCHSSFLKVIEAAQVNGVEVMTETES
ncbi:hypothetical protein EB796_016361 [Bugula neritina]|uniref:Phosphoinositide phospholipase C n=1 Tax=Bugula neritina TaxID=10212 RepID=A0A7J7JI85_BUGNE|nr:hypothetical protein EB796_016361 [Bugula neritina]